MLSRIAESLFWIGRYAERADGAARIVDVLRLQLVEGFVGAESIDAGSVLHMVMGIPSEDLGDLSAIGDRLVFDLGNPSSITGALFSCRENARRARETVSTELWEAINTTWHRWNGLGSSGVSERHLRFIRERAALIAGVADSSMSHDDTWEFLILGRSLERADMTARLVATGGLTAPHTDWSTVLTSCGAQQAVMRSHRGVVDDAVAATFLVLDRAFPRSVMFSLNRAEECLRRLSPESSRVGVSDEARRLLGRVRTQLEYSDPADLVLDLPSRMLTVQQAVMAASGQITGRYFQSGGAVAWTGELL